MTLNRYTRVGYWDFKKQEKVWTEIRDCFAYGQRFYDFEIVVQHYEKLDKKTKRRTGHLPITFCLKNTCSAPFYYETGRPCRRYVIFQRGAHDLKTAVWRKTYSSVPCFDPDYDEPDNSVYKKLMKRIRLGEFSN